MQLFDANLYLLETENPAAELKKLAAELARHGITGAPVSPLDAQHESADIRHNELLLEALEKAPPGFYAAPAVQPGTPISELEEFARNSRVKALRIYPTSRGRAIIPEEIEHAAEAAERLGFPLIVTLRTVWGKPVVKLENAAKAAEKHLNLNIVITGANYGETLQIVTLLPQLPNTYVEVSLYHQLNGMQLLARTLGTDRVLFGTAYPLQNIEVNTLKFGKARLDPQAMQKIARQNAEKLFNLPSQF